MRITAVVVLLAFALIGCAAIQNDLAPTQAKVDQAWSDLSDTTVADLQDAASLTPAADIEANACWTGLQPIVVELKAAKAANGGALPSVKGAFSTFQVTRNVVRSVLGLSASNSNGPTLLARINVACGPLVASASADAIKLGVKVAGDVSAASTGIGALPAAMKALNALKVLLPLGGLAG